METEMVIEKLKKEQAIIHSEMRSEINKEESIKEEILLIEDKNENVKIKASNSDLKKKEI